MKKKVELIIKVDGKEIATAKTDDFAPEKSGVAYDFDYVAELFPLIALVLLDVSQGLGEIEMQEMDDEVLH